MSDHNGDVHVRTRTAHETDEASETPDSEANSARAHAISQEEADRLLLARPSLKKMLSPHVVDTRAAVLAARDDLKDLVTDPKRRGKALLYALFVVLGIVVLHLTASAVS